MQWKTKLVEGWYAQGYRAGDQSRLPTVGSTAFSAASRGRKSPITCGVGMGELRRHNFEIKEESKGKEKDRRDEKGKGTEKGEEAWGNHQTLGEPVWLTRSKVDPPKSDKSKDCNQKKGVQ